MWFYSVYMDQRGICYVCRLENTEVLLRRNWSISTGNWSLVGVLALMTSTSFNLLCRTSCWRFTCPPGAPKNVWDIFSCYYIIILDFLTGERRGRRNQSTSPKRAQMKHKTHSLFSSFYYIQLRLFWILEGSLFLFLFLFLLNLKDGVLKSNWLERRREGAKSIASSSPSPNVGEFEWKKYLRFIPPLKVQEH